MKILLLTLICFIYSVMSNAQTILAGQFELCDYHVDVVPDYIMSPGQFAWLNKDVDINGDGVIDYVLRVNNSDNNHGSQHGECYIEPNNGNQITFSFTDSFYVNNIYVSIPYWYVHQMVYADSLNELIDSSQIWKSEKLFLAFYEGGPVYHSYNTFNYSDSRYIGVRVFTLTDTLYGWIRVKNIFAYRLILEEYACKIPNTGISEICNEYLSVYPNPANDILNITIQQFNPQCFLSIYNIYGQEIINQKIVDRKTQIEIKDLSCGIYIAKIFDGEKFYTKKIVKK